MENNRRDMRENIEDIVTTLTWKWQSYCRLFAHEETVALLNRFAPLAGRLIQDCVFDDVIMGLVRLMDPPKTNNAENLTLYRLVDHLENSDIRKQFHLKLNNLKENAKNLRAYRNKRLAHNDLSTASVNLLPPVSRRTIKEVLTSVQDLVSQVRSHIGEPEKHFEPVGIMGGAESLVAVFRIARRFKDLQDAAWLADADKDAIIQELRKRNW
jgi:hypothetical protein